MTKKERISAALNFERADRVPLLGGFVVSANHFVELSGVTEDEFFKSPERYAIETYRKLGVDGLILLSLPPGREGHFQYRGLTLEEFRAHEKSFQSPEDVLAHVEGLPSPGEALKAFDAPKWKNDFIRDLTGMQEKLGEIVWLPTQWDVIHPTFEWYNAFGYENYLEFLALYPRSAQKLFGSQAEVQRRRAELLVEIYKEFDIAPLVHLGTDICGKNGPVVSPKFLRENYFPFIRMTLEPLTRAGFRTVWHSDGVITPLIDDLLDCGISGFQGFQWEYGVRLEEIVKKRTREGERLTIFAGPSSSSTLPFGSKEDVRREIEHIIDVSRDSCALFLLPANCVLPDTPVENLIETYESAAEYGKRR